MTPLSLPGRNYTPYIFIACCVFLMVVASPVMPSSQTLSLPTAPQLPALDALPLAFIPNQGQFAHDTEWQTRSNGGTLSFQKTAIALQFAEDASVRLRWHGANQHPSITGGDRLESVVNYVYGNDPTQWHTGIPTHATLNYAHLYPDISLTYDGNNGVLKGTYTISAGADPGQIRWQFEGATRTEVDSSTGNLRITLPNGRTFIEEAPVSWQTINGIQVNIPTKYVVESNIVRFDFPKGYNPAHPLVIDPTLVYSSYVGEISSDTVHDIAVDGSGNVYVTGQTYSDNLGGLPNNTNGSDDAFVGKLNAAGSAWQWITYLGGSDSETGYGIAVNGQGNVWMTGYTESDDFPTTANAYQSQFAGFYDVILTRLSAANGSITYSTYYGYDNLDEGRDVALDTNGNIYVTGQIHQQNVLAVKFNTGTNPTFAYGVQWGDDRGKDTGYGIAVDGTGRAYVAGMTENAADPWGSTFPIIDAVQSTCGLYNSTPNNCTRDAFVSILNAAGDSLDYSTFLGGGGSNGQTSGSDNAYDIALDSAGNIYVAGDTYAYDFPTVNAAYPNYPDESQYSDGWVTKLSPNGQSILYSTYLGGEGSEEAQGITADVNGNAYVFGFTNSQQFPVLNAIQAELAPGGLCYAGSSNRRCYDAFVTKFNATGQVGWSTYHGGDYDEYGYGIARDGSGNLYIAGETDSITYPTVGNVPQTEWAGNEDGFVAKISEQSTPPPPTATPTQQGNPPTATPTQTGNPPTPTPTRTPIPNAKKIFLPLVRG